MHFALPWMNCLLIRQLPLPAVMRLWDTYLTEDNGFDRFHGAPAGRARGVRAAAGTGGGRVCRSCLPQAAGRGRVCPGSLPTSRTASACAPTPTRRFRSWPRACSPAVYLCATFLQHWSPELRQRSFQDMFKLLQQLPTQGWTGENVEDMLSQGYVLQTLFDKAPKHLEH